MRLLEMFNTGGVWMWVILAFGVAAFAIIVERFYFLYLKRKPNQKEYVASLENSIRSGDLATVSSQCANDSAFHPIAPAIAAATNVVLNHGGKEEIQGKMDEVLLHEVEKVESRIGFLAMLANVATLTGLLGTIAGMIKSFAAVANANPAEKATLLAGGISEAMNTTAFGLIVAIPTLVIFALMTSRGNKIVEDLTQGSLKVYNWLSYTFESPTPKVKQKIKSYSPQTNA